MTDRLHGFIVHFNKPIRDDDAEVLRQAILCLKNVVDVTPEVVEPHDWIVAEEARRDMRERVRKALEHPVSMGNM